MLLGEGAEAFFAELGDLYQGDGGDYHGGESGELFFGEGGEIYFGSGDDIFTSDDGFAGFAEYFTTEDFAAGEFDRLFNPEEYQPEDFGEFFILAEFEAGDYGSYAAIGDEFIEFGDHFEVFFGELSEEGAAAVDYFSELATEDLDFFLLGDLLEQVNNLDYSGFQGFEADFVLELFDVGLAGEEYDLEGEQWAGAFSVLEPEDIFALELEFIEGAIQDFTAEDFLGIPDD